MHTGHVIESLLLVRHVKASFVVRGNQGQQSENSGLHLASLERLMNAAQTEARTRQHSRTRTEKAWNLGFDGGVAEGDVQERKGPHIHVTGGNRKILGNG